MKKDLTYNEAFEKLQKILSELESGKIALDKLAANVKEAYTMIAICENKMRSIEAAVKTAIGSGPAPPPNA